MKIQGYIGLFSWKYIGHFISHLGVNTREEVDIYEIWKSFQKMLYQSLGKSLLHLLVFHLYDYEIRLSTDNKCAATQIGIVQKLM